MLLLRKMFRFSFILSLLWTLGTRIYNDAHTFHPRKNSPIVWQFYGSKIFFILRFRGDINFISTILGCGCPQCGAKTGHHSTRENASASRIKFFSNFLVFLPFSYQKTINTANTEQILGQGDREGLSDFLIQKRDCQVSRLILDSSRYFTSCWGGMKIVRIMRLIYNFHNTYINFSFFIFSYF